MTTASIELDITSLIDAQQPGYTLDRPFYVDPAIFELEMQRVFPACWLYAGHVSSIPNGGDYFIYTIASESIVILRDPADGDIRAFYNVCRHRGSHICLEPAGKVKKFVCPYHAWVYDTDGSLLVAKHMPEGFDKQQHGLHKCHVRVAQGLIFICLADTPPDFDIIGSEIDALFGPHGLPDAKICDTETIRLQCNWKVAADNTWECYHCSHSHPEYCTVMADATAFESPTRTATRIARIAEWEAFARSIGHHITPDSESKAARNIFAARGPIQPGYLTQSLDGQPVAPLMGRFQQYDGGYSGFMTFPIIWFVAFSDHAMLTRFTPINVNETEAQYTWLVRGDAVEGRDYDRERLTKLWRITADQDRQICEDNQAGINSYHYQPGPYSTAEQACDRLMRWYLDKLRNPQPGLSDHTCSR